jgi:DNA-directed RNA polymerase subunit RPC12/RpoP
MKDEDFYYCRHCHTHIRKNKIVPSESTLIRCINCGKLITKIQNEDVVGSMDDLNMRLE